MRADKAVAALLDKDGKNAAPRDWLLLASVRLQQAKAEDALAAIQKVLTNPKASRREQFEATVLQARTPVAGDAEASKKNHADALQRLAQFSEGEDDVALDSLILLAQVALSASPATDADQSALPNPQSAIPPTDLIARLEKHPLAKAPQKLVAVDLRIRQAPEERDTLIAAAVEQWKNSDALAALATWLNGHQQFERLLKEIPVEKALTSRDLFLQHLDALGALGRWGEIKRLLESERYPLDPVAQRMYLARCNAQLGEQTAADNNWQRALEAAGGDLQKLLTLAEYAEKNGAAETAAIAYSTAALVAPNLRAAHQGRLRMAQAARDTRRMHTILAAMLRLWPNDTAIQNDEAYTRLLLLSEEEQKAAVTDAQQRPGFPTLKAETLKSESPDLRPPTSDPPKDGFAVANPSTIEALAEKLVAAEPASLPHRTLLALARLKQNRAAEALAVYENIQATPAALTPSALAVHAAVLAANGKEEDARTEIANVPADRLLPEEAALIEALRR